MGERNRKKLKAIASIVLSFVLVMAISLGVVGLANFGFNFPNGNQNGSGILTDEKNALNATAVAASGDGASFYYDASDPDLTNNYYTDIGMLTQVGSSTTGSTINKVGDVYYSDTSATKKVVGSTIVEESGIYYTDSAKTERIGLSNPGALPIDNTDNWIDLFDIATNSTTTLLYDNITYDQGNFFKKVGQGNGSESTPYIISEPEELAFLAAYLQVNTSNNETRIANSYFKLGNNIDLSGKDWTPLFNQNRYFIYSQNRIHFDGDGHKITNAFVKVTQDHGMESMAGTTERFASIFGAIQGSIKNLTIENANVEGERIAAILANFGSDSYTITLNLENINILNSRVTAHGRVSGLAHRATDISGCQISNSEILQVINNATNHSFALNNASNQLSVRDYRANGIADQFNKLEKNGATKTTVSSCIISATTDLDNYNVGAGANFEISALGIGTCTNGTTFDVQNFDVADCVISNDVVFRTLQSGKEFASNGNLTVYLRTGAGAKGSSANSYNIIENIDISNCKIISKADYRANETTDTKLLPQFYMRTFGAVEASFQAESKAQNVNVTNVDIVDESEFDFVAVQDLNTATSARQSYAYSNIAGAVLNNRNDNSSDATSIEMVGLNFKESTITVNHNFKMPRNTTRKMTNNVYISGIYEKYNETIGWSAIHKGCAVENILINTNQEIETWADTQDKNVNNQSSQYLGVMVMGNGTWTKDGSGNPCSVKNVALNPTMKYYRDADDKYISNGNVVNEPVSSRKIKVMFFGYASNIDVNIDGGSVEKISIVPNTKLYNKTYTDAGRTVVTNNHNPITGVSLNIYGVYRTWTTYNKVHNIQNFKIADIYVNADGKIENGANERDYLQEIFFVPGFTLAHGISYANYNNVTVKDIYVNYLANTHVYISGLAWEENVSNGGETYVRNSTVENYSVISKFEKTDEFPVNSFSVNIITLGHVSWSANSYAINFDNFDVRNSLVEIQDWSYAYSRSYRVRGNSHVDGARNFYMTNSDIENVVYKVRVEGQQVTASGLFYREQYRVNDQRSRNVVENSTSTNMLFDVNNTENQINAGRFNSIYVFQMGYYYGDFFKMNNCVSANITKNIKSLNGIYSGAIRLYNGTNNTSTGNAHSVAIVTNCKNINENVIAETTKRVGTSSTAWTAISGMAFIEYRYAVDYVFDNCVVEDSNYVIENDTNYTRFTGILYDNSQTYTYTIVSEVNDCCFLNSNVCATLKESCLPGLYARLYGIAFGYIRKVQNCINTSSLYAYCASETYVNGIASANKGIAKMYYGDNQINSDPIVENCAILNCYNYGDLEAKTISGKSYTTGIGTAELIDSCANYGKLSGVSVGGIMWGKADHNAKTFLTIRNCLNAGDIYKVENVNDGYLGGIIGYVSNYYGGIESVLRIENNINLGGIYAGTNTDGTPKETLTFSNYMGGIFGWLSFDRTQANPATNRTSLKKQDWESARNLATGVPNGNWQEFVTNNQIINNYTLAVLGGKNNHLSPDNTTSFPANTNTGVTGDGASSFAIPKGTTNGVYRISTPYGTYGVGINSNNANTYTGVTTLNYLQTVTRDCFSVSATQDSNHIIGATFNTATFAQDASLASYSRVGNFKTWELDTTTQNYAPQVEQDPLTGLTRRKVVMFDLKGADGTTPRPIVADVNNEGEISIRLPRVELDTIGTTITGWTLDAYTYAVDAEQDFTFDDLMITLNAVIGYDTFTLKVDTTDATVTYYDGESIDLIATPLTAYDTANGKNFTLETEDLFVTSTTTAVSVNAVTWQVYDNENLTWVNLSMSPSTSKTNNIDFMGFVSNDLLENYVDTSVTGKIITIKAVYAEQPVYTITLVNVTIDPLSNPENYVNADKYSLSVLHNGTSILNTETGKATVIDSGAAGETITIETTPNNYYSFVKYEIDGGVGTRTNASINLDVSNDYTITIYVAKTEYDINITLQNLQNVEYDSSLQSSLIQSYSDKMVVDSNIPQIQANTNVSGYRFVGWKLKGMGANDFIPSENGNIANNFAITEGTIGEYLINVSGDKQFNLIAVFQKQYVLNISMDNPEGDSFKSTYELIYTDENGVEQHITNIVPEQHFVDTIVDEGGNPQDVTTVIPEEIFEEGLYTIDENTFVKIKITPNKRVRVLDPEGVEFGGNIAYIFLTDNTNVEFKFEVRPLTLNSTVLTVETPASFDGTEVKTLDTALAYYVEGRETAVQPDEINIDETLVMAHNGTILDMLQYRYLNMYLKNLQTGSYDVIDRIVVGDDFFDKYVTDDGKVDIMMKVIKQYAVIISGHNLVSEDEYKLGSYDVTIKNGSVIENETNGRYTVIQEKESYLVDIGLSVEIIAKTENNYAKFAGFTGLMESEDVINNSTLFEVKDNRSITVAFEKEVYSLEIATEAEAKGELAYTKKFSLGDTISISYTPANNYVITDWTINQDVLDALGATQVGNTITFVATQEVMDKLAATNLLEGKMANITTEIKTMMSPTLFYGIIGGGGALLLLFVLVVILVLRSAKIKKQKEETERRLNDMARKFNVADAIKDLKAGGTGGI